MPLSMFPALPNFHTRRPRWAQISGQGQKRYSCLTTQNGESGLTTASIVIGEAALFHLQCWPHSWRPRLRRLNTSRRVRVRLGLRSPPFCRARLILVFTNGRSGRIWCLDYSQLKLLTFLLWTTTLVYPRCVLSASAWCTTGNSLVRMPGNYTCASNIL